MQLLSLASQLLVTIIISLVDIKSPILYFQNYHKTVAFHANVVSKKYIYTWMLHYWIKVCFQWSSLIILLFFGDVISFYNLLICSFFYKIWLADFNFIWITMLNNRMGKSIKYQFKNYKAILIKFNGPIVYDTKVH